MLKKHATCTGCGHSIVFDQGCWQDDEGYACPAITTGPDEHVPAERVLDAGTVLDLAKILDWCIGTKRITWLDPQTNELRTGTARNVGDENANVLNRDEDLRDGFFRITTSNGFELFMPVMDALPMVRATYMVEGDHS